MKVINKEKALALQERFNTPAKVEAAFKELQDFWSNLLSNFTLKTGDEKLDRMAIWNQSQCVVTYNYDRSASYSDRVFCRALGLRSTS